MKVQESAISLKDKVVGFVWQHLLLVVSLFVMTFGVALCVRSALGSSVISTIPFVLDLAGQADIIPSMTIGEWTIVMNFVLVGAQIAIMRCHFDPFQLFQLIIGFLFGWLLDVNMALTQPMTPTGLAGRIAAQIAGCLVLAVGIAFELRCGSVTMPGEGLPAAIAKTFNVRFANAKIGVDIALVMTAVTLGFALMGRWMWEVVGPGTLFAMVFVGAMVKVTAPRIGWFDNVLAYRPGFRRYVWGLAKFIFRR